MNNKVKLFVIFVFSSAVFAFACAKIPENETANSNSLPPADKQIYKSVGVIKAIDVDAGKITIDHEDIPGYMSAMEMTESVGDKSLLQTVKTGDKVEFEIERAGAKIVITKINKIGEVAVVNGGEIYTTNCAICHGAAGEGAKKGIPLISGHALNHSEAEYVEQINNGEGKKMPAFKDKLSAEQIASVVKFVREDLQKEITPDQRTKHHHH